MYSSSYRKFLNKLHLAEKKVVKAWKSKGGIRVESSAALIHLENKLHINTVIMFKISEITQLLGFMSSMLK